MKNIIAFLLLLTFWSCEPAPKPNEPFYCKVDGKRFRPNNGGDAFLQALLAQRDKKNNLFYITAIDDNDRSVNISAKFKNINEFTTKLYRINQEFKGNCSDGFITVNGMKKNHDFESFENGGFISFTKIDTVKQIVSGTFEFKAKSKETNKTISITKGQFNDLFYY